MSAEPDQNAENAPLPSQSWTWVGVVDDFERAEGAKLSPADRIRLLALRKTAAELDSDYQKSLATTLLNTLDRMNNAAPPKGGKQQLSDDDALGLLRDIWRGDQ